MPIALHKKKSSGSPLIPGIMPTLWPRFDPHVRKSKQWRGKTRKKVETVIQHTNHEFHSRYNSPHTAI
jgi:hypothetical protein